MYRIRIDEIKGDKIVKLCDENVECGILKCGRIVGMFGFSDPTEIVFQMEEFAENLAIRMSGIDEADDPDEDEIIAVMIAECIIGINIAALALGPLAKTDAIGDETKKAKLQQYAFELLDKGKEIASVSDAIRVSTFYDYRQKLGELLMEELDKLNEDED